MAITLNRLHFKHNPVAWAEFRHQRHVINTSRSGGVWILMAGVMLFPGLLFGFVLFGAALFNFAPPSAEPDTTMGQIFGILWVMMLTMNIALYGVVILITLGLSARSISREKTGKTWDALVLTNIDARTIVLGKWWASLRALWGDHLMVVALRLGFMGSLMLGAESILPTPPAGLSWNIAYVLPLAIFIFAYSAVDAAFTAALGVATTLSEYSGSVTGAVAVLVRIFTIIGMVMAAVAIMGSVVGGTYAEFLTIATGGLIAYALLTWGILRVAEFMAVRGQVSAPGK